jgi:hypothetical protein
MSKYSVGDKVMIKHINSGTSPATVVKVGRVLVTVKAEHSPEATYRIDTGARNDNYGHSRIMTLAKWEEFCDRNELINRLAKAGLKTIRNTYSCDLEWLRRVVEAAEQS